MIVNSSITMIGILNTTILFNHYILIRRNEVMMLNQKKVYNQAMFLSIVSHTIKLALLSCTLPICITTKKILMALLNQEPMRVGKMNKRFVVA